MLDYDTIVESTTRSLNLLDLLAPGLLPNKAEADDLIAASESMRSGLAARSVALGPEPEQVTAATLRR